MQDLSQEFAMNKIHDLLTPLERFDVNTEFDSLTIWRIGRRGDHMYEFARLEQEQTYPPHIHEQSHTELHVVSGTGSIILDGTVTRYQAGDRFTIPKGTSHGFNVEDTTFLFSSQCPPIMSDDGQTIDIRYQ